MVLIYDNLIKVLCSVEDLLFIDIMSWFDFKMYILDKKKVFIIWKVRLFEDNVWNFILFLKIEFVLVLCNILNLLGGWKYKLKLKYGVNFVYFCR